MPVAFLYGLVRAVQVAHRVNQEREEALEAIARDMIARGKARPEQYGELMIALRRKRDQVESDARAESVERFMNDPVGGILKWLGQAILFGSAGIAVILLAGWLILSLLAWCMRPPPPRLELFMTKQECIDGSRAAKEVRRGSSISKGDNYVKKATWADVWTLAKLDVKDTARLLANEVRYCYHFMDRDKPPTCYERPGHYYRGAQRLEMEKAAAQYEAWMKASKTLPAPASPGGLAQQYQEWVKQHERDHK